MAGRTRAKSAYARAGVDIDEKMKAFRAIRRMVNDTMTAGALSKLGTFGGMFASPGREYALVASTDGVGTKLKVAAMAGRHDTVGQDIVNHCVNDILVQGARPMFFMDYFGTSRIDPHTFLQVIKGLCKACRQNGCTLLGGETAEMPGLYPPGEYDLVGTIVGVVPRRGIVTGAEMRAGDVVLGLPSTGLHTNGYSLARKVIFETAGLDVRSRFPGMSRTVGEVLLAVHKSYLKPVTALMRSVRVRGIAHITGGGLPDNVERVVPAGLSAIFDTARWTVPTLFRFIEKTGRVDREEMYRVFNMGIGMVLMVRPGDVSKALASLRAAGEKAIPVGRIEKGRCPVRLVL